MPITFTKPATVSVASAAAPPAAAPLVDAAREQAGMLLVKLFHYLEEHAVEHPALLPAVAGLRDAVADYRAGGTADALGGVRDVVALINAARRSDPGLPEP